MNKNIIGIDHGNHSIKTCKLTFPCGLAKEKFEPYDDKDYILYEGSYYTLRAFDQDYLEDKTINENYLIYTLFAIMKQYEQFGTPRINSPMILAVGLPPNHLQARKEGFISYFMKRMGGDGIEFVYHGKKRKIAVEEVMVFPQGHAASYAYGPKKKETTGRTVIRNRIIGQYEDYTICDIGGITCDIIPFEGRKRVVQNTKTELLGINSLIESIEQEVEINTRYKLRYRMIEQYLKNNCCKTDVKLNIPDVCIPIIEETINNHINKIFDAVTRATGDIRVATIIFMGGGSILLRNYIENMTGLNKEFIDFITDEKANAEGFEMLAKDYQRMKDVAANGKRS